MHISTPVAIVQSTLGVTTMKKVITIICVILSAILILDGFGAWHALVFFYLAGQVPGTHISVNADTMLAIFAMLSGFVIGRISQRAVISLVNRIGVLRPQTR